MALIAITISSILTSTPEHHRCFHWAHAAALLEPHCGLVLPILNLVYNGPEAAECLARLHPSLQNPAVAWSPWHAGVAESPTVHRARDRRQCQTGHEARAQRERSCRDRPRHTLLRRHQRASNDQPRHHHPSSPPHSLPFRLGTKTKKMIRFLLPFLREFLESI